ncbi:hypothetical protein SB48_HM08orf04607 [Heyndrickxia coagulans]|uniref:Uncharacterized protein n=1 Tax=Heyndrickxia coagulans TaxID=1398 RepID=A0A0C5C5T6_HEYCO|nr:hypothetical protein SB48_HM08orf04607 [Heyndrickxia coagulans]KYC67676.1 hypothetical protein B4099_0401 [Heyndrickxia coagulans]
MAKLCGFSIRGMMNVFKNAERIFKYTNEKRKNTKIFLLPPHGN